MKKTIFASICILILLSISSFGTLINPDSLLTEAQVETYINNSDFNFIIGGNLNDNG